MKSIYALTLVAMLAGCATTAPEIVYKDRNVAVSLPRSQYEVDPIPEPMSRDQYMALDALGRKTEDGKLLLKYQKHIKHLRDRIESLWDSSEAQKQTIERKSP